MTNNFPFINRSTNAFFLAPSERQTIARHAQKLRRKLRAQEVKPYQSRTSASPRLDSSTSVVLPDTTLPNTSTSENETIQDKKGKKRLQIVPAVSPRDSINEYALSALTLDRGSFEVLQYLLSLSAYGIENFPIALMLSTSYTTLFHLGQIKMLSSTAGRTRHFKGEIAWEDHSGTADMFGQLLTAGKFFSVLGQIVQGALNSPVHMYALLTVTACGMKNTPGVTVDPKYDSEYLMGKALPHLRKELARIQDGEGLIDKQVVLDI